MSAHAQEAVPPRAGNYLCRIEICTADIYRAGDGPPLLLLGQHSKTPEQWEIVEKHIDEWSCPSFTIKRLHGPPTIKTVSQDIRKYVSAKAYEDFEFAWRRDREFEKRVEDFDLEARRLNIQDVVRRDDFIYHLRTGNEMFPAWQRWVASGGSKKSLDAAESASEKPSKVHWKKKKILEKRRSTMSLVPPPMESESKDESSSTDGASNTADGLILSIEDNEAERVYDDEMKDAIVVEQKVLTTQRSPPPANFRAGKKRHLSGHFLDDRETSSKRRRPSSSTAADILAMTFQGFGPYASRPPLAANGIEMDWLHAAEANKTIQGASAKRKKVLPQASILKHPNRGLDLRKSEQNFTKGSSSKVFTFNNGPPYQGSSRDHPLELDASDEDNPMDEYTTADEAVFEDSDDVLAG